MVEEKILGVIPRARETGFMKAYDVVITDRRIIWESRAGKSKRIKKEVKGGFLKRLSAARHMYDEAIYQSLDPNEILREHEKNFAYDYKDIKAIKLKGVKEPSILVGGGDDWCEAESKLIIETASGKKRTFLFNQRHFDKAKNMLQQVAGNKLTIKMGYF